MKPLRALAGVAVLVLLWLGWRVPAMRADYAAAVASGRVMTALPSRVSAPVIAAPVAALTALPHPAPPHSTLRVGGGSRKRTHSAPSPHVSAANVEWAGTEWGSDIADSVTIPATSAATLPSAADALATTAYRDLAKGNRRAAATGFATALAADPTDPRAAAWYQERRRLTRRWSGDAYVYARDAGPTGFPGAALLGGGQSGGSIAFTPDPLARRPLALVARLSVPHYGWQLDNRATQAAVGLRWQVMPNISLSAERLIAAGPAATNDWTLRLAGGAGGTRGRVLWSVYGEGGLLGLTGRDAFAAVQGYGGYRLPTPDRRLTLSAGIGAWGGVQSAAYLVDRVDVGPSLRLRWARAPLPVALSVDYRVRVAGNAAPGSGVAVTLSTAF